MQRMILVRYYTYHTNTELFDQPTTSKFSYLQENKFQNKVGRINCGMLQNIKINVIKTKKYFGLS